MAHLFRGTRFATWGGTRAGRCRRHLSCQMSNKLQQLPVYDFACDPSVANSIVQPSSQVLGYVYRPYTANSGSIGLRYFW